MKSIAVTNFKGGVAKTTTAFNLVAELSRRGERVLAIDLDRTQLDLMNYAGALPDVHFRELTPGRLERALAAQSTAMQWDWAVMDCPPVIDRGPISALVCADIAVVPVVPEVPVTRGLVRFMDVLAEIQATRVGNPLDVVILLSMVESGNDEAAEIEAEIRESLGAQVFCSVVPRQSAVSSANNNEQSIFDYAPRSSGARAFSALVDDLMARQVEAVS